MCTEQLSNHKRYSLTGHAGSVLIILKIKNGFVISKMLLKKNKPFTEKCHRFLLSLTDIKQIYYRFVTSGLEMTVGWKKKIMFTKLDIYHFLIEA